MTNPVTPSPWRDWRGATPARIALGRAGNALPTDEVLRFGLAHALARDAIHEALDLASLRLALPGGLGDAVDVCSQASDRSVYLRRPDLGRRLSAPDADTLAALQAPPGDLCIVIGDGLSSIAVNRHAPPLLAALLPQLATDLRLAPLVVAQQARVALADEIAALVNARLVVILIGERPGLSSPDSLGAYLTHGPFQGRADADRNCVSNIRPEGLPYGEAAFRLAWLIRQALHRGVTGIALKDDSDSAPVLPDGAAAIPLPEAR